MNDSERKDYMKVYNKSYKKQKDSIVEYRYSYFDLNVQPTDINFKGTDEAAICAQFGCGKKTNQYRKFSRKQMCSLYG